jgi:hypothetical protein
LPTNLFQQQPWLLLLLLLLLRLLLRWLRLLLL